MTSLPVPCMVKWLQFFDWSQLASCIGHEKKNAPPSSNFGFAHLTATGSDSARIAGLIGLVGLVAFVALVGCSCGSVAPMDDHFHFVNSRSWVQRGRNIHDRKQKNVNHKWDVNAGEQRLLAFAVALLSFASTRGFCTES